MHRKRIASLIRSPQPYNIFAITKCTPLKPSRTRDTSSVLMTVGICFPLFEQVQSLLLTVERLQWDYSHLPVREEVVDVPEDAKVCACCGLLLETIGHKHLHTNS